MKEMRAASQVADDNWMNQGVNPNKRSILIITTLMNYDYTDSDIPDKQLMSPNQYLYNAPTPIVQWSINDTMHGHLAAGVTSAAV